MEAGLNLTAVGNKSEQKAERWSRYLVSRSYLAIVIYFFVLVAVWFFYVRVPDDNQAVYYWLNFILFPTAVMLVLTAIAGAIVRSERFSLKVHQYTALLLLMAISGFAVFVHSYAAVLLVSYIVPVMISTVYADVKLTRNTFFVGLFFLALSFTWLKINSGREFEGFLDIEGLAALGLLAGSFSLSKLLILFGEDSMSVHNANITLEEQLMLDPLTDLYNRKAYNEYIPRMVEECQREGKDFSLAELDIDDFKLINDTFGHVAGDRALLKLADAIRKSVPKNVFAFRLGGEEFALAFTGLHVDAAAQVCRQTLDYMASLRLPEVESTQITCSCGVAGMTAELDDPASLYNAADEALYAAKLTGKNRAVVYGSEEQVQALGLQNTQAQGVDAETQASGMDRNSLSIAGVKTSPRRYRPSYTKAMGLGAVTVSILEDDAVFRDVLKMVVENLNPRGFDLVVNTFADGYDFLNSDWYLTDNLHVIITNDILPRQNGLEVLHRVRKLPNKDQFFVYMMTQSESEQEMVYGYESGADRYLVKPINLRLLEADLRRTFERLLQCPIS